MIYNKKERRGLVNIEMFVKGYSPATQLLVQGLAKNNGK